MENIIVLFEGTLKPGKMENREEAPADSNSFWEGN